MFIDGCTNVVVGEPVLDTLPEEDRFRSLSVKPFVRSIERTPLQIAEFGLREFCLPELFGLMGAALCGLRGRSVEHVLGSVLANDDDLRPSVVALGEVSGVLVAKVVRHVETVELDVGCGGWLRFWLWVRFCRFGRIDGGGFTSQLLGPLDCLRVVFETAARVLVAVRADGEIERRRSNLE